MSFGVAITRTLPLYPQGVFLQWDLVDPAESGVYGFTVYRSGSPEGPWDPLAVQLTNTFSYLDRFPTPAVAGVTAPNQVSLARGIFYRVVATPPSGATNAVEAVSGVEPKLDGKQRLLKRKILRDEALMLQKLNGVEVAVLKRRHWGTRCTRCYDKYTKDSIRANCSSCYGTTFVGGYFDPILTWAKRGTTPNQVALAPEGKTDIAKTHVTMLDAPAVQDDDVLVFLRDNRRFLVRLVLPTELRTVTVHQRLEVAELPRSDIAFRVKVESNTFPRLF